MKNKHFLENSFLPILGQKEPQNSFFVNCVLPFDFPKSCYNICFHYPLDETHLDAVRGFI